LAIATYLQLVIEKLDCFQVANKNFLVLGEAPNAKHQITNKFQRFKFEKKYKIVSVIRNWNLELIWNLGFVI